MPITGTFFDSHHGLVLGTGVSGSPFRLNHALVCGNEGKNKGKKIDNLFISSARPVISSCVASFKLITRCANIAVSGFNYESEDQLLRMYNVYPVTGALIEDPSSPANPAITTTYADIEENIVHTIHKSPSFKTGGF